MSAAIREVLTEAPGRGIHVRVDGDELVISGDGVNDKFIGWARRHKSEILAELAPPEDDVLLPVVRQNRFDDFTFDEPEPPIPDPLPPNNEYLKAFLAWASRRRNAKREWEARRAQQSDTRSRNPGRTCGEAGPTAVRPGNCSDCNGGGCRACDYFGTINEPNDGIIGNDGDKR